MTASRGKGGKRTARWSRLRLNVPLLVILVGAVAVVAYALTLLHASFRSDDFYWTGVIATPQGVTWDRVLGYFYSPVTDYYSPVTDSLTDLSDGVEGFYRPVYLLSWALDYVVWGVNPLGYTLTNVLLHAATAVFVALITLELGGRQGGGLLAGVLFALYPTHPFSMNYVSDRPDVLATAFYLLALFAYLRFRGGRGRGYLVLSLGALVLALLSKEIAVSFPVVILIYELYRRTPWREVVTLVGAFGAIVVGYLILRYLSLSVLLGGYERMPTDPVAIVPTLMKYLGLMLAPYNPNLLGQDYSLVYLVTLLVVIVLILVLVSKTSAPNLVLFLAAFLATFLPTIRLFMGKLNPGYGRLEQNQHVYLASAFFCVGLALLIWNLDRRAIKWSLAVVLVVFYTVVQSVNNQPWLIASDLVRSAQRYPEQLPVSTYQGAAVFPYHRVAPKAKEYFYMGYEEAMSPWFRGSPLSSDQDDWREWREAQGTLLTLDGGSGRLELETAQGIEPFTFERENLQIRLVGDRAEFRELEVGQNAIVRFVQRDGENIARSVEVQRARAS